MKNTKIFKHYLYCLDLFVLALDISLIPLYDEYN